MSAEAWRRIGSDLAPLELAWQACYFRAPQARFVWQVWYFRYLHRCPRTLGDELGRTQHLRLASIDVRGRLATNCRWILRGRRDTFSTSGSTCVTGLVLFRCPRTLGGELGRIWRRWILRGRRDAFSPSGSICVAGVVLSVPPRGSLATNSQSILY